MNHHARVVNHFAACAHADSGNRFNGLAGSPVGGSSPGSQPLATENTSVFSYGCKTRQAEEARAQNRVLLPFPPRCRPRRDRSGGGRLRAHDAEPTSTLLEQAARHGLQPAEVLGDGAYGTGANRRACAEIGTDLHAKLPASSHPGSLPKVAFDIDLKAMRVTGRVGGKGVTRGPCRSDGSVPRGVPSPKADGLGSRWPQSDNRSAAARLHLPPSAPLGGGPRSAARHPHRHECNRTDRLDRTNARRGAAPLDILFRPECTPAPFSPTHPERTAEP